MELDGGQRFHAVTADHAVLGAGLREFRIVPQEFDQFPAGNSHVGRLVDRRAPDYKAARLYEFEIHLADNDRNIEIYRQRLYKNQSCLGAV